MHIDGGVIDIGGDKNFFVDSVVQWLLCNQLPTSTKREREKKNNDNHWVNNGWEKFVRREIFVPDTGVSKDESCWNFGILIFSRDVDESSDFMLLYSFFSFSRRLITTSFLEEENYSSREQKKKKKKHTQK